MEEPWRSLGLRPATAGLKGSDAHLANTTPLKTLAAATVKIMPSSYGDSAPQAVARGKFPVARNQTCVGHISARLGR